VKGFAVGVLIGLAVGLPAGAGGWWAYSKSPGGDEAAERQLAGEVASEWIQRRCPFCTMADFDRTGANGWRLTIRTENGKRLCYRMEIERFAIQLEGLRAVRPTSCDYAPEAPAVVASGALRGDVSWALQAYESDRGLCLEVVVSGPERSAGGGCGFGVGKSRPISFARRTVALLDRTWIFGPAANAVQQVSVSLDGGRTLDLDPLSVPGFQVRCYVTTLPASVGVRSISAKDGRGITLETLAIESPVPAPRPSSDPDAES
jgi:hypothetical protein